MALTEMWLGSEKYLCDRELAHAFHMARVLGMPLLIEGEPGTDITASMPRIKTWICLFILLGQKVP